MQYSKERRFRRFNLEFPVSLTFSAGGQTRLLRTTSKNVSIGGLLLRTNHQVPLHTPVNLTMHVQGPAFRRLLHLVAEGEVVRVERSDSDTEFAIAVECKYPIMELGSPASP